MESPAAQHALNTATANTLPLPSNPPTTNLPPPTHSQTTITSSPPTKLFPDPLAPSTPTSSASSPLPIPPSHPPSTHMPSPSHPPTMPLAQYHTFPPFSTNPTTPLHTRRLRAAPPTTKTDWLPFVNSLEWLVNAEIDEGDRKCPFCWGEFGLEEIEEEDSVSDEEVSSDEEEGGGEWSMMDGAAWALPLQLGVLDLGAQNAGPSHSGGVGSNALLAEEEVHQLVQAQIPLLPAASAPARAEAQGDGVGRAAKRHYAVKLRCGHLYGHMCLVRMLESGERLCPKCRRDIVQGVE